ncbi:MAG TPA: Ig-like domain-containing protein [Burkholderiales bacterium]|nr:Ig-like domain-containing protein [Burkholderiales bacterium]
MTRTLALCLLLFCASAGAAEFGVYRSEAPAGPASVDAFELWLGKSVQLAEAFEARDIWDNIDGAAWQLGPWSQWVRAKAGRNLVLSVPMLPGTGGVSLASCAAGQYDVYWRNLANELAYYGLHWAYLRLGWEMDGNWYAWGAPQGSGQEANFAGCFRRIVTTMRATQPASQWKFVWNPTATWTDPAWLNATWPGDAYVDLVGIDLYDQSWVQNTYPYPSTCDSACRLARQQTAWNTHAWYLQTMRNFAVTHGKPFALPEWGVVARTDGHGGGDNPYFIQKMYEFIADPANYVQFSVLFDANAPEANYNLSGLDAATAFPQAAAKFRQLFATVTAPTPTPAPVPVPVPAPAPTPAADATPPSVALGTPPAGTVIRRRSTVTMEASASDNVGVVAVEFSINGRLACRVLTSPYRCSASVGNKNDTTYTLTARALDAAGNAASYSRTYSAR